jgi:catechol 2,3-dioxygenase-like lactoylglutathione lyase family enzyme
MIRAIVVALLLASSPATAQTAPAAQSPAANGAAVLMAPALRATDLDRSVKFYGTALGLVVGTTLHHGTQTEVILCSDQHMRQTAIILFRDETPGKSPPIVMGNGFDRVVMRVPDVAAVATRMKAAGYPVGEVHASGAGPSILRITDPDGYGFELVQIGPAHG